MTPFLDGARVLVTGASSGIGAELARILAPRAAHLVLVARRVERLDALSVELRQKFPALQVTVLPCDLSDLSSVKLLGERLKETVGEIDVFVNNAGATESAFFEETDWEKTERLVTLNALAPAWLLRFLLPGMVARGRGGVLSINSGFGFATLPSYGSYAATKHFMYGLVETVRAEVAGTGVVITQSCPGPVDTEIIAAVGHPLLMDPPKFTVISASQCARESLAAFEKGVAVFVPGRTMRLASWVIRNTPGFVRRSVQAAVGRRLRGRRGR